MAQETEFCWVYRACQACCRNCEHLPANLLKDATPEQKAEWEAARSDLRNRVNAVCLLGAATTAQ